jgi:hypothetical protein
MGCRRNAIDERGAPFLFVFYKIYLTLMYSGGSSVPFLFKVSFKFFKFLSVYLCSKTLLLTAASIAVDGISHGSRYLQNVLFLQVHLFLLFACKTVRFMFNVGPLGTLCSYLS